MSVSTIVEKDSVNSPSAKVTFTPATGDKNNHSNKKSEGGSCKTTGECIKENKESTHEENNTDKNKDEKRLKLASLRIPIKSKLQQMAEMDNLQVVDVPGDGTCLYHAVALLIGRGYKQGEKLRTELANYVKNMSKAEKIEFAELLTFGNSQQTQASRTWKANRISKLQKFEKDIRRGGWAGELEIGLIAKLIQRNIVIYNTQNCQIHKYEQYGFENTIYLGFLANERHYTALTPKANNNSAENAQAEQAPSNPPKISNSNRSSINQELKSCTNTNELTKEKNPKNVSDAPISNLEHKDKISPSVVCVGTKEPTIDHTLGIGRDNNSEPGPNPNRKRARRDLSLNPADSINAEDMRISSISWQITHLALVMSKGSIENFISLYEVFSKANNLESVVFPKIDTNGLYCYYNLSNLSKEHIIQNNKKLPQNGDTDGVTLDGVSSRNGDNNKSSQEAVDPPHIPDKAQDSPHNVIPSEGEIIQPSMALTQNSPPEMLTGISNQIVPEEALEETEAIKEKEPFPTMNSVINSDSEAELFISAIQGSNNTKTKQTHGESGRINQDKSIASEAALENISQLLQTIPESSPYDPFEFMLNAPTSPYETLRTGTTQYEHIFTESRQSPDNDNENNSLVSEATEENPLSTQRLGENIDKYPMDSPQKTPEASSKLSTNT